MEFYHFQILSYATLIRLAIINSPNEMATLSGIYQWISDNFPYYKTAGSGWKVRHLCPNHWCWILLSSEIFSNKNAFSKASCAQGYDSELEEMRWKPEGRQFWLKTSRIAKNLQLKSLFPTVDL